jgi:hydroxymethylbilane synthase
LGCPVELKEVRTRGDVLAEEALTPQLGQNFFTKELENALLDQSIDLAVHSMKDLGSQLGEGLIIAAVPPREDVRDALVSLSGWDWGELPQGCRIGTSSIRRKMQMEAQRPDLKIVPLRGNLDTRLKKLAAGEMDAACLAMAGLKRLYHGKLPYGLGLRAVEPEVMVPAAGQGALALQVRRSDDWLWVLESLNSEDSRRECILERAFMAAMNAGCQAPLAVWAQVQGEHIQARARMNGLKQAEVLGASREAETLGLELSKKIKQI